jgi:hypothetical protein
MPLCQCQQQQQQQQQQHWVKALILQFTCFLMV